jgi:hypothetical protein
LEAFLGPQEGEEFKPFRVSLGAADAKEAHGIGREKLLLGRGY